MAKKPIGSGGSEVVQRVFSPPFQMNYFLVVVLSMCAVEYELVCCIGRF